MKAFIAAIFMIGICLAQAQTKDDRTEKLRSIRLVFVDGNNQAASHIRKELKKEKQKGCLREALKAEYADAVLELWSESERLEDEPLSSGGKTAAKVLLGHLQEQVCVK